MACVEQQQGGLQAHSRRTCEQPAARLTSGQSRLRATCPQTFRARVEGSDLRLAAPVACASCVRPSASRLIVTSPHEKRCLTHDDVYSYIQYIPMSVEMLLQLSTHKKQKISLAPV